MSHMGSRQWLQRTARVFAARRERRGFAPRPRVRYARI